MSPLLVVAGSVFAAGVSAGIGLHTVWFGPWLVLAIYTLTRKPNG